jgi:hypothetical protein
MSNELDDLFDTGEKFFVQFKKDKKTYKVPIRKFRWDEFSGAEEFMKLIDDESGGYDSPRIIPILSSMTGIPEDKIPLLGLIGRLKLTEGVITANADFFQFLPLWTARVQAAVVGVESPTPYALPDIPQMQ